MVDQPHISHFYRSPSGLYLPGPAPELRADTMAGVLQSPSGLAVPSMPTSFVDDVYWWVTETELGLTTTPIDQVRSLARLLPLWSTLRALSGLQRELAEVRIDTEGQASLADTLFGPGHPIPARYRELARREPRAVLFTEQQLHAMQRLVMLSGWEEPDGYGWTDEDYTVFGTVCPAIPGTLLDAAQPMPPDAEKDPFHDYWLRFFIATGGFFKVDAPAFEIARSYQLYEVLAKSAEAKGVNEYCPLDEWLRDNTGFTFRELMAVQFVFFAAADMLKPQPLPVSTLSPTYLSTTPFASRATLAFSAVSAQREWYQSEFSRSPETPRRAALDILPFLRRPGLTLPNAETLFLSPRAAAALISTRGIYYRLLDMARGLGGQWLQQFSMFNGYLTERYVYGLAMEAYPDQDNRLPGSGRVFPEQEYGSKKARKKTSDVAIDLGTDLVLLEVTAGRFTESSTVEGDASSVLADINKLIIKKAGQLGRVIADLLSGAAQVNDIDMSTVVRIWPVVVSSEGVFHSPALWAYVDEEGPDFGKLGKTMPLVILDLDDVERLLGMVKSGISMVEVLRRKTSTAWRTRDFRAWAGNDAPKSDGDENEVIVGRAESAMSDYQQMILPQ